MGLVAEFFENFDGTPTEILWTDDYETPKSQEKLYKLFKQAEDNSYIICCSILKRMKKAIKDEPLGILKNLGLKNCHSYTVLQVKEITLDNGNLEYIIMLRNPTGNIYLKDDEVWKGDWSPLSEKWTQKTRR